MNDSRLQKILYFIQRRRISYVQTFTGPVAEEVLRDLAKFCRANETCFDPDPRIHAVLEGRREVWLRIQEHLRLSDEQLMALRGVSPVSMRSNDNE